MPSAQEALDAAIAGISGQPRPGQQQMATAIADAISDRRHLLVQAGTGTGKSLGYLIPVLLELASGRLDRAVIATATLALQAQLAGKDVPAAMDAVQQVTGRRPTAAILKGRSNYACRLRVNGGEPAAQQSLIAPEEVTQSLHPVASEPRRSPDRQPSATGSRTGEPDRGAAPDSDQNRSALGIEVLALRDWAQAEDEAGGLADRDDAPPHTDRAWQQVSVPVRECIGATNCPFGDTCFVERSREQARAADLVITNHTLLAIDAMHGRTALPEHELLIVDEAHELESRVTRAVSAELAPALIHNLAKRAGSYLADGAQGLKFAADKLSDSLDRALPGRITAAENEAIQTVSIVQDAARQLVSALNDSNKGSQSERSQVLGAVEEIFDIADRIRRCADDDVIWIAGDPERDIRVAPLAVDELLRQHLLSDRSVIMTSATLKIGGDFDRLAGAVGLLGSDRVPPSMSSNGSVDTRSIDTDTMSGAEDGGDCRVDAAESAMGAPRDDLGRPDAPLTWSGLDVGSPFDYRRQGILYVARHLPKPGQNGMSDAMKAEIAELVRAAGGRTLGLFSSRRAAQAAASHLREQLPGMIILCQGELQLRELTHRFIDNQEASLFGTLSLWQGLDVAGETCQHVIIDRIPFPRPDEPLMAARQQAVNEAGGNGFIDVAATHAGLLLAQGAGRLIRRSTDRGVVAVLDPRLATARYAPFLRAGMPGMWPTTDRDTVMGSLRRLSEQASSTPPAPRRG